MKIPIQVAQNYLSQNKGCIMLTVEDARTQKYHFNIPDTTQRYQKEHFLNFAKGSRLFFTELSPENANGLLGMMCTMSAQDRSEDSCLFGAGIVPFLESARYLMQLNMNMQSLYDFQSKQTLLGFSTGADLVKHFVSDSTYCPQKQYKFNQFIKKENLKANDASRFINESNQYKDDYVSIDPIIMTNSLNKMNVAYIITTKQIAGKVIKEKLKEFNVPPKMTGQLLKDGQVTLPDGKVVLASEVKEEDIEPQVIIIADISDETILKQLINSEKVQQLKSIACAVTIARPEIIESDIFQLEYLNKLKPTQHLIVNEEYTQSQTTDEAETISKSHSERVHLTNQLHHYFPRHFPNLSKENITSRFQSTTSPYLQNKTNEFLACPLKEMILYPFKTQGYSLLNQTKQKSTKTKEISEEFISSFAKLNLNEKQNEINKQDQPNGENQTNVQDGEDNNKEMQQNEQSKNKVVFLGTGSMMPLPLRTVSAILIENEEQHILLDCGEGTYSQLLYQYGVKRGEEIVKETKFLFISHIHLDHCLGMFYFLQKRDEIIRQQSKEYSPEHDIYIMISSNLAPLIRSFNKHSYNFAKHNKFIMTNHFMLDENSLKELKSQDNNGEDFEDDDNVVGVDQKLVPYEHPKEDYIVRNYFRESLNDLEEFKGRMKKHNLIDSLSVCEVIHCGQSYGIALNLLWQNNIFKISYSGDTRPCSKFEEISRHSDVFIHECTFSDDLQKNAEENNHATLTEAIESCKKSESKQLVLTHFSQRYSQIDVNQFKGDQTFLKEHTTIAFDHFQATFSDYTRHAYLPSLTQIAQTIFPTQDNN